MRVRIGSSDSHSATVAFAGPLNIFVDADAPAARSGNLSECTVSVQPGRPAVWQLGKYRFAGRRLGLCPTDGGKFNLNGKEFRGQLWLYSNGSDGFYAVDGVDMEDYIAGVVTAESYASYPIEALKAQAIAARTYALFERNRHGDQDFDLTADQNSQVYGGVGYEKSGRKATDATKGQVLVYGPRGGEQIFCAFFASTCGGGSISVQYFKPDIPVIPPLAGGVACEWCQGTAHSNWGPVSIPRAEVWASLHKFNQQVPANDPTARVAVEQRDKFGRILTVRVTADSLHRPIVMLGDELRRAISPSKIKSMLVDMTDKGATLVFENGHGFGHGAGLCQVGAAGMARAGRSAEQILGHYYPGAMLKRRTSALSQDPSRPNVK